MIQTRFHFTPAPKEQGSKKKIQTPKIAISLLSEQELQDSGLKPSAQVGIHPSQWP